VNIPQCPEGMLAGQGTAGACLRCQAPWVGVSTPRCISGSEAGERPMGVAIAKFVIRLAKPPSATFHVCARSPATF
jgi:hypothetical protein